MNFRQVEIFCTIMERASLTEAALHLGLSQPAVSKSLKSLEDQLGLKLFNRTTRGLHATDEARELHAEARRVLQGFSHLDVFAKNLHRLEHARLIVGVMPALSTAWLARVVASFSDAYPNVSILLRAPGSANIVKQVAQNEIDVGVAQVQTDDAAILKRKLSELHLVCIVRADHRLAAKDFVTPGDIDDEAVVLLAAQDEFRRMLDARLIGRKAYMNAYIEATHSNMICSIVEAGRGIGIVDSETASLRQWPSLVSIPLRPTIRTPIYLITNSRSPQNLATKRFCEHIMKLRPAQHPS